MADTTTTANMGLTKPTPSPAGDARVGPLWATDLNGDLDTIDEHDHTSGKGVQIPVAGINIDGDLEFNSHAATELEAVEFAPATEAETSTRTNSVFVDSADNKVKYRNNVGTLKTWTTADGDLDITVSGGIGGDYGSGDESFEYDAANTLYKALSDNSPSDVWAGMSCGDVRIHEKAAVSNYVALVSPDSLAASYVLTMPVALASGLVTVDGTGQMAFEDTIPDDLTFSGAVELKNASVPVGDTLSVDGVIDVTGVIDLPAYGSGIRHGEVVRVARMNYFLSGINLEYSDVGVLYSVQDPNPGTSDVNFAFDLDVRQGERITEVSLIVNTESLDNNPTWGLYASDPLSGAWTAVETQALSGTGVHSISLATPEVVDQLGVYAIRVVPAAATGSIVITSAYYKTDKVSVS